jgi:hypothetical protein
MCWLKLCATDDMFSFSREEQSGVVALIWICVQVFGLNIKRDITGICCGYPRRDIALK